MTGLDALLAGDLPTSVYRWHDGTPPARLRRDVEAAGWHLTRLDGAGVTSKAGAMAAFQAALGLPEHFGANYDALWDCLRDIDEPMLLVWEDWGALAVGDEYAFATILEILGERADQGGFAVLLRGDGPDVDLPWLD